MRLSLRAVDAALAGSPADGFLQRRLASEAGALDREGSPLAQAVGRLLRSLGAPDELPAALLGLAEGLERGGDVAGAAEVVDRVRTLRPRDPIPALHAARLARKDGDTEAARTLYRRVREMPGSAGRLGRLARVGEALVDGDSRRALSRVLREAVVAGDAESAAVAQEERARIRRSEGDRGGALRDYLVAWGRYPDPADRARTLHSAADLLSAGGDLLAARELLLQAVTDGRTSQRDHAVARLHALSRSLGDDLGRRRWRGERPAPLVSLIPSRVVPAGSSRARRVAEWTRRLAARRRCRRDA